MSHLSEPKFYIDILEMPQTERDLWDDNEGLINDNDSLYEDFEKAERKAEASEEKADTLERTLTNFILLADDCDDMRVAELRIALKDLRDSAQSVL